MMLSRRTSVLLLTTSLFLFLFGLIQSDSCGNGHRGDGRCATQECCSEWGWCGRTADHCGGQRPPNDPGRPPFGYKLAWSDEFDGGNLDRSKWEIEVRSGKSTGNNELQFYTDRPANIFVEGGNLNLRAVREDFEGYGFTSGRIHSRFATAFGYFEIRAKVPRGRAIWPAIWLLPVPTRTKYGTWAACGEIDIMETVNEENTVYGTLHFGGEVPRNVQFPPSGQNIIGNIPDRADNFHTFGVHWTDQFIKWYVDGELKQTVSVQQWFSETNGNRNPAPAPFDQPFNIILNNAVGGAWPCGVGGCPPDLGRLPSTLVIDYVRVYKP